MGQLLSFPVTRLYVQVGLFVRGVAHLSRTMNEHLSKQLAPCRLNGNSPPASGRCRSDRFAQDSHPPFFDIATEATGGPQIGTARHQKERGWLLPRHGNAILQFLMFFLCWLFFAKLDQERAKRAASEGICRVVISDWMPPIQPNVDGLQCVRDWNRFLKSSFCDLVAVDQD